MSKLIKMMGMSPADGMPYIHTTQQLAFSLLMALLLAGIMMGVYRLCHNSMEYDPKFNTMLLMLSLTSTLLLALIQNNPALSLGALGALSICRIRINTRDPRNLGFVFWSLLIGISSALGVFLIGITGTMLLSAVMLLIGHTPRKKDTLTLVVRGQKNRMAQAEAVFHRIHGTVIQSKNVYADTFELVYDVKSPKGGADELLLIFNSMEGIDSVNVLAPETQVV